MNTAADILFAAFVLALVVLLERMAYWRGIERGRAEEFNDQFIARGQADRARRHSNGQFRAKAGR